MIKSSIASLLALLGITWSGFLGADTNYYARWQTPEGVDVFTISTTSIRAHLPLQDANGRLFATGTGSGVSFPIPVASTSFAAGTGLSLNGDTLNSAGVLSVNGATGTITGLQNTISFPLPAASTTQSGAFTTTTINNHAGLVFTLQGQGALNTSTVNSTTTFYISTSSASVNGLLLATDWVTFNSKITTTSLSASLPLVYNNVTGLFTHATTTVATTSCSNCTLTINSFGLITSAATGSSAGFTTTSINGFQSLQFGVIGSGVLNSSTVNSTTTFSIATATVAVDGFLRAADFVIFNSKITTTSLSASAPLLYNNISGAFSFATTTLATTTCSSCNLIIDSFGRVTSAATGSSGAFTTTTINGASFTAYTFATSGSSNISISTSSGVITWTQPTSTASVSGYLSSADWTLFNAKQNSLGSSFVSSTAGANNIVVSGATGAVTITFNPALATATITTATTTNLSFVTATGTGTFQAGTSTFAGLIISGTSTFNGTSTFFKNVGIGTSSPANTLSIVGGLTVSGLVSCSALTTTATGTIECGAGGAGISSLNGLTASTQTFSTTTMGGLEILSSGSVHTIVNKPDVFDMSERSIYVMRGTTSSLATSGITSVITRTGTSSNSEDNRTLWQNFMMGSTTPGAANNSSSGIATAFDVVRLGWEPQLFMTVRASSTATSTSATGTVVQAGWFSAHPGASSTGNTLAVIAFIYDGKIDTGGFWSAVTASGTARTKTTTTVPFATGTPYKMGIVYNQATTTATGTVTFYLNGKLVASHADTSIPASSTLLGVVIHSGNFTSSSVVANSVFRAVQFGRIDIRHY